MPSWPVVHQCKALRQKKKEKFDQPRDARYIAEVVGVGESPVLAVQGKGVFPFAYRSVKKRPGEPRALISVGDIVECRLTAGAVQKAISVRILSGSGIPLVKCNPMAAGYPAEYEKSRASQSASNSSASAASVTDDSTSSLPDLEEEEEPLDDEVEYEVGWVDSLLTC